VSASPVDPVADRIVGRRAEQDHLDRLVDRTRTGQGGAVVILGDAGLGKSALVRQVVAERRADMRVIELAGVEVESRLAFAGLATLVNRSPTTLDAMDPRLADVLRGAVGRADVTPTGLDVNLATLAFVTAVAAGRPTLVVVDDVHWLDQASLSVLTFVARRLADDPAVILLACRPTPDLASYLQGIPVIDLEPLALGHSGDLLARLDVDPLVAAECWRCTGGNPLALLELGRALRPGQRSGAEPLAAATAAAARPLHDLFAARLAALGDAARHALVIAALDATSSPDALAAALLHAHLDADLLRSPELAGFVASTDRQVTWHHPLMRSTVLREAPPHLVRSAHRALADATSSTDPDRSALHRAGAAEGPDDAVADRLDELARAAEQRGAPSAAAEAWEHAARLSVDPDRRFDRVLASLTARWALGESERVVTTGRPLVESTTDPVRRARLALIVGQAEVWWNGPIAGARYLSAEGDRVAPADPAAAGLLEVYAANAHLVALDPEAVVVGAARTARLAEQAGDPGLPFMAAAMESLGRLLVGEVEAARALLEPLAQLCPALLDAQVHGAAPMAQVVAFTQIADERWDDARGLLLAVIAEAGRTGFVGMQSYAHDQLSEIEWRQGRWPEAASRVAHMATLAEGHDQPIIHQGRLRQARLDACRGRTGPARDAAATALEIGQRIGLRSLVIWAREVLALAALADDDPAEAARQYDALAVLMVDRNVHFPGLVWWQAQHVESLAVVGRTAEARLALDRLRAAGTTGRWAAAAVARGDAAVAPDAAEAAAHLDRAVSELQALGAAFELATVLERRGGHHAAAGNAAEAVRDLSSALARYDHLDARPWADRTAAALVAVTAAGEGPGIAEPARSPALAALLTDAEMRVALAVGSGLTNREAADELFLSVKTVDSHLQAIYRKLEIRSRSQLAALVARDTRPAG
jgi:DNA-binding CsgD family transcriptional regulator